MGERLTSEAPSPRFISGGTGPIGTLRDDDGIVVDLRLLQPRIITEETGQDVQVIVREEPVAPQEEPEEVPKIDWMLPSVPTEMIDPSCARTRKMGADPRQKFYTMREAAAMLRHSADWVKTQVKTGRIQGRKVGGKFYVSGFELYRQLGEVGSKEAAARGRSRAKARREAAE